MNDKIKKIIPKIVKGFSDNNHEQNIQINNIIAKLQEHYLLYGFEYLQTPAFEYTEVLGKHLPDSDRPEQGVFSIQDEDKKWMSLRYDLTAPLARYVAENLNSINKPFKRQQTGIVWRNEKPGVGRLREFVQCDVDIVGSGEIASDAEIIIIAAQAIEKIGVDKKHYVVKVNSSKLLDALLMQIWPNIQINSNIFKEKRKDVLRAIDKKDRLGIKAVIQLLAHGRVDESGDFTKGAQLDNKQIQQIENFINALETKQNRQNALVKIENSICRSKYTQEAIEEMIKIDEILNALKIDDEQVQFDTSVVRGLDYYTGIVLEAELLFDNKQNGKNIKFGSIAGGGRYDGLIEKFGKGKIPAVGFSIGVTRIAQAMQYYKNEQNKQNNTVVVLTIDKNYMQQYFQIAQQIRNSGINVDLCFANPKMAKQLKYADKIGAKFAIIQGEDERKEQQVTIKNLEKGKLMSAKIKDNQQWKKAENIQITIKQNQMIQYLKDNIHKNE